MGQPTREENTGDGDGGGGSTPPPSGGGGGGTTPPPTSTPDLSVVIGKAYGLSSEYAADNPTRMPSPSNSALLAAARQRRELLARQGRQSTRLVGTQVYTNLALGSTA